MGSIETIFDEAGNDGGFADVLFANEDNFFFFDISFVSGVTDFILLLVHFELSYLIIYNFKHLQFNI